MIKYVVISPVKDEEKFIEKTIQSMIRQTVLPLEWIIVNDGSRDYTKSIIEKYLAEYLWIKKIDLPDRGFRAGQGPAEAFNEGRRCITADFDFIINLDGDVSFEKDYFERLFEKFREKPALGIASGKSYYLKNGRLILHRSADYSTMGASKVYRQQCFQDIGGALEQRICWDIIDDIKAQMKGWHTRSFSNIKFIHHKRIGFKQGNIVKTQMKAGQILYTFGYHPLFLIGKGLYRVFEKPCVIGSLAMLYGYLLSWAKHEKKFKDKELIKFIRAQQIERMKLKWFYKAEE